MTPDLTIFVSTFNRTTTLEWCLHHLKQQRRPHRVVVVDNGSKDDLALAYLDDLEARGYRVYRMPAIEDVPEQDGDWDAHGGHSMQAVQRNVQEAFRQEWMWEPHPTWFGMTDADVWLDGNHDSLDVYIDLAAATGRAVGPHLRLDTHENYPLRAAAIIQHARILFRNDMTWHDDIPYSPDPIDTTFHLFPSGPTFNRLGMSTARVGDRWMATHSDWLIDIKNPSHENHAYILGCGEAASWGGRWIRPFFQAWLRDPEGAYEWVSRERIHYDDYDHAAFMHAWCLQYGHGCQQDLDESREVLREAIPDWAPVWSFEEHWDAMVYDGDFSCLGWDPVAA